MAKLSLEKRNIKILLLEGIHPSATASFTEAGYVNIEAIGTSLSPDELTEKLQGAYMVGIRSRTQLTAEVIAAADRLISIGCFCIGTNQVDLVEALRRGIPVFNAPFSNTRSVAELVIAESILLLRGIPAKNAAAHRGEWKKSAKDSYEIRGKTIGIIGYGNIGSQVSVLAEALGMRVVYHDIIAKLSLGNATQLPSLHDVLAAADIVTLHVPDTADTRGMIGAGELAAMKPGAILINASRGTVVDIPSLTQALAGNYLLGAAIDVFPKEPKSNDEEFYSSLREFDNCILTPHVGGSTLEAQENIGREVATKLIKYCDNGSTVTSVNFPEVALPAHPRSHRILHIHENIPGVLSEINTFFSESQININSQFLQTNENVGYVVMDVNQEYSAKALEHLRQVKGTIRTRILF